MTDKAAFSTAEWDQLRRLPWWVVDAASAVQPDGALGTAAEKEVGLLAISWGRESGNAFVAGIAEQLTYAEIPQPDEEGAPTFTDLPAGIADVLARCRQVSRLLTDKADQPDAVAYRAWLVSIAEKVTAAARSGGVFGIRTSVTEVERQFVVDLSNALAT